MDVGPRDPARQVLTSLGLASDPAVELLNAY